MYIYSTVMYSHSTVQSCAATVQYRAVQLQYSTEMQSTAQHNTVCMYCMNVWMYVCMDYGCMYVCRVCMFVQYVFMYVFVFLPRSKF
jgi:hypothetical protein